MVYRVIDVKEKRQDQFTKKHNVKLGFMSFSLKRVKALEEVAVNSKIEGEYNKT